MSVTRKKPLWSAAAIIGLFVCVITAAVLLWSFGLSILVDDFVAQFE